MSELTEKQSEVLAYIKGFIEGNGYPPSIQEIARKFCMCDSAASKAYLEVLEKKGYISRVPGKSRSIRVLK